MNELPLYVHVRTYVHMYRDIVNITFLVSSFQLTKQLSCALYVSTCTHHSVLKQSCTYIVRTYNCTANQVTLSLHVRTYVCI